MNDVKWDLSQLVKSTDRSEIVKELDALVEEAGKRATEYRGKIRTLDAEGLKALFEEREEMQLRYEGAIMYSRLRYSADTTDAVSKQLNDAVSKAGTKVGQQLAFVDIELSYLLKDRPELVKDPVLAEFRHALERTLRAAPHLLSEEEEKIIMSKDQNGAHSWSQLQREWLSTRTFPIEVEGKRKKLPYGQVIGLYGSPDRKLRRDANRIVYGKLGKDEIVWSTALRSICDDHLQNCDMRKYPTPETSSLIYNDVEQGAIDALMATMKDNVGVYRKYLKLKAEMMDLDRLGNWDIMAPLPKAPKMTFTWDQAHETVVKAYGGFDPQLGEWSEEMYQRQHIDAAIRPGKVSGAFCSDWYGGRSAYVLQSFNGRLDDVYTQAHEMGHSMHAYLTSRSQRATNTAISYCIAECGSIFGELLLTDHLIGNAKDIERKAGRAHPGHGRVRTGGVPGERPLLLREEPVPGDPGRQVSGRGDDLVTMGQGAGRCVRRFGGMAPGDEMGVDDEDALLHPGAPLLQLSLRVRSAVRVLHVPPVPGTGKSVRSQVQGTASGRIQPLRGGTGIGARFRYREGRVVAEGDNPG